MRLPALTLTRAIELAEQVAATVDPSFKYNPEGSENPHCYYLPAEESWIGYTERKGQTGCLVGRVLLEHGVDRRLLVKHVEIMIERLLEELELAGELTAPPETVRFLAHVQSSQDYGETWLQSIEEGKKVVKEWL